MLVLGLSVLVDVGEEGVVGLRKGGCVLPTLSLKVLLLSVSCVLSVSLNAYFALLLSAMLPLCGMES